MSFGVLCTSVLTVIIGFVWSHLYSDLHPNFNVAIVIYCISAILVFYIVLENLSKYLFLKGKHVRTNFGLFCSGIRL